MNLLRVLRISRPMMENKTPMIEEPCVESFGSSRVQAKKRGKLQSDVCISLVFLGLWTL